MNFRTLKPFLSLLIIITSLFSVVFIKMENRRQGYELLKLLHEKKSIEAQHRIQAMNYARMIRPDRVENYAQTRLELQKAASGQIIPMTSHRVTLRQ